MVYMGR